MTRATTHTPATPEFAEFEDYLELPESMRPELTLEAYLALPVTKRRLDVIDGIIVMAPAPSVWHQELSYRFQRGIDDFVAPRGLGQVLASPLDVLIRKLPKLRTRQPDIAFFGADKLAGLDLKRIHVLEVAPDLVVEIISPSDRPRDWAAKLADYASIGVREVWRADPEAETIEVLALDGGRYARAGLFGREEAGRSAVLPGLALPLAAIFG